MGDRERKTLLYSRMPANKHRMSGRNRYHLATIIAVVEEGWSHQRTLRLVGGD